MTSALWAFLTMERLHGWGRAFAGVWRAYTRFEQRETQGQTRTKE